MQVKLQVIAVSFESLPVMFGNFLKRHWSVFSEQIKQFVNELNNEKSQNYSSSQPISKDISYHFDNDEERIKMLKTFRPGCPAKDTKGYQPCQRFALLKLGYSCYVPR